MKYMSWSWQDLMSAPDEIVREIIRLLNEQAEQAEINRLMS
jgi:hypothetical protein